MHLLKQRVMSLERLELGELSVGSSGARRGNRPRSTLSRTSLRHRDSMKW